MDGGEEVGGDGRGQRRPQRAEEPVDHLPRRRGGRVDPVDVPVAPIVGMVIDVENGAAAPTCLREQPLGAVGIRTVRERDDVEGLVDALEPCIARDGRQEVQHGGRRVRPAVPEAPAPRLQSQAEGEQGAQHVGVGMHVPQHQGPTGPTRERIDQRGRHVAAGMHGHRHDASWRRSRSA